MTAGRRVVLVVAARVGDAELGMGMRIRWYADRGDAVHVHCLSTPAAGWRTARDLLGVSVYGFSAVEAGAFGDNRGTINAELFRLTRRLRPDVVYTAFPNDHDPDRRTTGEEVRVVALREALAITFFRTTQTTGFTPTLFFVGDAGLLAARQEALRALTGLPAAEVELSAELAAVAHREHIHHRVVERMAVDGAPNPGFAEMFVHEREIQFGYRQSDPRGEQRDEPEISLVPADGQ